MNRFRVIRVAAGLVLLASQVSTYAEAPADAGKDVSPRNETVARGEQKQKGAPAARGGAPENSEVGDSIVPGALRRARLDNHLESGVINKNAPGRSGLDHLKPVQIVPVLPVAKPPIGHNSQPSGLANGAGFRQLLVNKPLVTRPQTFERQISEPVHSQPASTAGSSSVGGSTIPLQVTALGAGSIGGPLAGRNPPSLNGTLIRHKP